MTTVFSILFLAMLFGFFGVFFRGRLSGCAGDSCSKRQAGSCGCPPEESDAAKTPSTNPS